MKRKPESQDYTNLLASLRRLRTAHGVPDEMIAAALAKSKRYRRFAAEGWSAKVVEDFCRAMSIPRRPGPARTSPDDKERHDALLAEVVK